MKTTTWQATLVPLFFLLIFVGTLQGQSLQTVTVENITPPRSFVDSSIFLPAIRERTTQLGTTLMAKDYQTFATLNHPKLQELVGGADELAKTIEGEMKQMEASGFVIIKCEFGDAFNFVECEGEIQCVVTQIMEMKMPERGRIISRSYLVGISSDAGNTWYFLDVQNMGIEEAKKMFPNLCKDLQIPPKSSPQIFSN